MIALVKDVPDVGGDRSFAIKTLSVRLGAPAVRFFFFLCTCDKDGLGKVLLLRRDLHREGGNGAKRDRERDGTTERDGERERARA